MGAQTCGAFVSPHLAFRTSQGAHSREVPHRVPNPMKHSFHDVGALHKNSKKRDVSCNAKDQNGGLIKQRAPNRAHRAHTAHSTARTARSFPSKQSPEMALKAV